MVHYWVFFALWVHSLVTHVKMCGYKLKKDIFDKRGVGHPISVVGQVCPGFGHIGICCRNLLAAPFEFHLWTKLVYCPLNAPFYLSNCSLSMT